FPSSGFLPGVENINASLVINGPRFHYSRGVLNKTACLANEKCTFVIPYFGNQNQRPVKRYCNTSLTEQPGTHVITNVAETPDLKLLYSTFVGSSGTDVCCYQTTVDGSEHGYAR
ncbi:hypothetical protein MAR_000454, partial [Mya arenaria]